MKTEALLRRHTRHALMAAVVILGASSLNSAMADDVIYQSATDNYSGNDDPIEAGRYLGAEFTLSQATSITGLGAQFVDSAAGSVFGVIVPVSSGSAAPTFTPSQIATAGNYVSGTDVVFNDCPGLAGAPTVGGVPVVDYARTLAQPVTLGAGTYAVVFGAGAFGASSGGFADIGYNNTPTSGADIFYANENIYGDVFETGSFSGAELFVEGNPVAPVPLPAGVWLLLSSLGGLCLLGRTRISGALPLV